VQLGKLVNPDILRVTPYKISEVSSLKGDRRLTKLDLNENFMVEPRVLKRLLLKACGAIDLRRYPDPQGSRAAGAIADFWNLSKSNVLVGNGSDDVLDRLTRAFVRRGSKILVVEPTFPMYTYYIQLCGGDNTPVLLRSDFSLDTDAILESCCDDTNIVFICSPNNPTGVQFREEDVKKVLDGFSGLVVVDEAYADFARYTVAKWIQEFENLVVLRSFSKVCGLAGIRVGYLLSSESIVEYVRKASPPFNVSSIAQGMIIAALQNWSYFKRVADYVKKERERLWEKLSGLPSVKPYRSDANFILFKIMETEKASSTVEKELQARGILVKDRGGLPLLENCMRVTVGTRTMNNRFLSTLKQVLEE